MPPRKTRKKGLDPSPDLPGLFPTHDGSYGINTLVNVDPESGKGHKLNPGIAREQSDDNKWMKSMRSKVAKKYGMNTDLKRAIDQSHKEVEEEESHGQATSEKASYPPTTYPSTISPTIPTVLADHSNSSTSYSSRSSGTSRSTKPSEPLNDSNIIPKLTPHIPTYNPNNLPFSEEYDDRPRPPYKRAELPSTNLQAHAGVTQPISPLSDYIPFYGMPQGEGSTEPIIPARPDSSRSFSYESGLFANATLQTPRQPIGHSDASQTTTQDSGIAQNQTAAQSGNSEISGTGRLPTSQSSSGMQPSSRRQPHSGGPTPGFQPTSGWQPTLGGQPSSSSFSNHDQFRNQPKLTTSNTILEVPQTANIPSPRTNKQGPTKQVAPEKTAPRKGRGPDRRRRRVWPSSDLLCRSAILFFLLAITLWFTFSTIPIELSDYDNLSLPRGGNPLSDFSIGRAWKIVSDMLPEFPDTHGTAHDDSSHTPSGPAPSDANEVGSDEVLRKVEKLMPGTIWVRENHSGKLKIPEDFWYALRQLIEEDDSLLSLKNSDISEDHWRAVKSRIQNSGGFGSGTTTEDMDAFVEKTATQSWDSWLEKNDQAIKNAIVGVALTKDDFLRLFQQEIASYQHEIQQELGELQEKIQVMSQQMFRLQEETGPSDRITKGEMTRIIDSLVSKAISNVKLDAVAHGLIKGHADDVLANQVDYFGTGSGASIDPEYCSAGWVIPKNEIKFMKQYLDSDGYKALPPRAALSPWSEDGECFCAKPDNKGHGEATNSISVMLSRNIIPQHLVVEHILPGATLDPGAMPREIEVWAYIEETNLRNEVRTFSETQFPDTPEEEVLNDGFVKIGHFTYQNKTSGDGVQVFKISDELTIMDAITNWVVVRAINNYGADHTCFYRLRLYGEVIERPDDPPAPANAGRSWRPWSRTPV
ncbi:hypothetical protein F5B17DRAFT_139507 [Nemania serpens]|nr:hypothetical protein F5B17DRAFT_139507 [Nemania serpens]